MSKPFKVDELLKDHAEDREALELFARAPGRTVEEVQTWLESRGYVVSRTACYRWKSDFDELVMRERMAGAGSMAKAFMSVAKDSGGLAIPDAAVMRLSQMIFEKAGELEMGGDVDPGDLGKMALSLQRLMLAKARLEATRSEFVDRERKALDEASKLAASGGSAGNVVDKVRQILGLDPAPTAHASGGAK